MATQITQIKIFIASPSDVAEERNILKAVVDEINVTAPRLFGVLLDLIGWENHVYPSFANDAQDVINQQINDDYDIFIGIMWSKFGSPTKRDTSGTKEEFERAYKKYLDDPKSVYLLFYFKDTPIALNSIDIKQLSLVKEFQAQISVKGGLYKSFTAQDEFEKMLRINLTSILHEYKSKLSPKLEQSKNELAEPSDDEDDEIGIYELIENSVDSFAELSPVLSRITDYTTDIGNKMGESSKKLTTIKNKPQQIKDIEVRSIIDNMSIQLINYSKKIDVETPTINNLFGSALKSYSIALEMYRKYDLYSQNPEEVIELKTSLLSLKNGIAGASENIQEFVFEIKKWPSLTTKLAKGKKQVVKALNALLTELNTDINLLGQLIESLEKSADNQQ